MKNNILERMYYNNIIGRISYTETLRHDNFRISREGYSREEESKRERRGEEKDAV